MNVGMICKKGGQTPMTKKGIEKVFNNMKESCKTVVSLRNKGL